MPSHLPERLPLTSLNIAADRLAQLRELLPGAFAEIQVVPDKLAESIGTAAILSTPDRYGLSYAGRAEALREMLALSSGTLRPDVKASENWDATENLIIEGDNLHVLKLFQSAYAGSVNLIYIDPPYNTGNDFVYPDNFRQGLAHYKEQTKQTLSSNPETSGRYHSDWLKMMHPRLALARNLLRDDGVIFVSIDDHEVHNLRLLMDEVFGEENFVAQVTVQTNPKGRVLDPHFARTHDYVLIYTRAELEIELGVRKSEAEVKLDFDEMDERGVFRSLELRNTHRQFGRHNRWRMWFALYANPKDGTVALERDTDHVIEIWPRWDNGFEGCWTWGEPKVRAQSQDLYAREVNGRWKVYRKARSVDDTGEVVRKKLKTIFLERAFHTEKGQKVFDDLMGKGLFQAPKPVGLLSTLLQLGGPDDLVLDFFAGSGTTGHAVLELNRQDGGNRKFILVQYPQKTDRADFPTIADITRERVRRVIARRSVELASGKPEGFRAYRLDESNFKLWDGATVPRDAEGLAKQLELMAHNVVDGCTDDDLLAEILLKCGHPGITLSSPTEVRDVVGQQVHLLASGSLAICLSRALTKDILRGIIALSPTRVLCLDVGFHSNDELKTNSVLEMKSHGIQFQTV
jgi:adenine-specific DNA-methyltransferase